MKNKEIYQKDKKIQGIEKSEKGVEKKEKVSKLEEEILKLEKKLSEKKKEREIKYTPREKIENNKATGEEVTVVDSPFSSLTDDVLTDDERVENLIKIVFKQGLEKAIEEVKSLNNPYILDEFHDRLIERLRELGKKEKKMEK